MSMVTLRISKSKSTVLNKATNQSSRNQSYVVHKVIDSEDVDENFCIRGFEGLLELLRICASVGVVDA